MSLWYSLCGGPEEDGEEGSTTYAYGSSIFVLERLHQAGNRAELGSGGGGLEGERRVRARDTASTRTYAVLGTARHSGWGDPPPLPDPSGAELGPKHVTPGDPPLLWAGFPFRRGFTGRHLDPQDSDSFS